MRLVLASASPRRADLLRAAGFVFDTLAVDLDERVQPGEAPAAYVRRLAMEKSARAWEVLAGTNPAEAGSTYDVETVQSWGPALAGPWYWRLTRRS